MAYETLFQVALIFIGFALLAKSASSAIKRIVRLAHHFGMSEFVISFLFVGVVAVFPEFILGVISAIEGSPSFGLGIVIGSNIADLTLIAGIVALSAHSLRLHEPTIKEMKMLVIAVALPALLIFDGDLSRGDGLILIASFIAYVLIILKKGKISSSPLELHKNRISVWKETAVLFLALGVLLLSGHIITGAATHLSAYLSLPIFFIGILVAVGTCLPELTVAIRATQKKHGELGLGDILGNVFADCMATLGIIALISPIKLQYPTLTLISALLMLFAMLFLVTLFHIKKKITRADGAMLIGLYFVMLALQLYAEFRIVQAA